MNNIRYVVADDGIATATIDMPGRPFNVFSDDLIDEFECLLDTVTAQPPRGIIVTSGKDAFMAGADLAMVKGFTTLRFRATPAEVRATFSRLSRLLRRLECLPVPTVAAVNGLALGGGLELAMACHRRIAVETTQPCLGLPEVLLGLLPGAGGTQRLPRLTGLSAGARMLLGGQPITPADGLSLGLLDALVAPGELLAAASRLLTGLSAGARWDRPGWQAPTGDLALIDDPDAVPRLLAHAKVDVRKAPLYPALGAICQCLIGGFRLPMDEAIEYEADQFLPLMLGPVAGNMVRTSFLSKTAAPKRATQALGAAPTPVKRVAVTGLVPARLARHLAVVSEDDEPELRLTVPATNGARLLTIQVQAGASTPSADESVELRYLGDFDTCDAVEVAGTAGPVGACALSLVNRLRMIPVATVATTPGPSARLLRAAADSLAAHPGTTPAGIANAVDLGLLLRRLGITVADRPEFTAEDRAAGLALLVRLSVEAEACMAEELVAAPADLDVLAVFALGYPAWTGGPLSFRDMLGRGEVDGAAAVAAAPAWYAD